MSGKQPRDTAWTMRAELSAPTPTAVWACRSRFCLDRGPFWVKSLKDAQRDAMTKAAGYHTIRISSRPRPNAATVRNAVSELQVRISSPING